MFREKPKRVWVEGDIVHHEACDGTILSMTAEVSLMLTRMLGAAGADALLNRVKTPRKAGRARPAR